MADGLYVDTSELRALGADLEGMATGISLKITEEMAKHSAALAARAGQIARAYPGVPKSGPSPTGGRTREEIGSSVRARPLAPHDWVIEASGVMAGLWELGNKGSSTSARTFRHPTWGSPPWQDQPKWPFLRMAEEEYMPIYLGGISDGVYEEIDRYLSPAFPGAKVGRSTIGTFLPIGPY